MKKQALFIIFFGIISVNLSAVKSPQKREGISEWELPAKRYKSSIAKSKTEFPRTESTETINSSISEPGSEGIFDDDDTSKSMPRQQSSFISEPPSDKEIIDELMEEVLANRFETYWTKLKSANKMTKLAITVLQNEELYKKEIAEKKIIHPEKSLKLAETLLCETFQFVECRTNELYKDDDNELKRLLINTYALLSELFEIKEDKFLRNLKTRTHNLGNGDLFNLTRCNLTNNISQCSIHDAPLSVVFYSMAALEAPKISTDLMGYEFYKKSLLRAKNMLERHSEIFSDKDLMSYKTLQNIKKSLEKIASVNPLLEFNHLATIHNLIL